MLPSEAQRIASGSPPPWNASRWRRIIRPRIPRRPGVGCTPTNVMLAVVCGDGAVGLEGPGPALAILVACLFAERQLAGGEEVVRVAAEGADVDVHAPIMAREATALSFARCSRSATRTSAATGRPSSPSP